jgi:hypothetical protein
MTRPEFDAARKTLALTIREFCDLTGLHPTTVSRWGGEIPAIPGWVPQLLAAWRVAGVPRTEAAD